MVPVPEYSYNYWRSGSGSDSDQADNSTTLTCFMPNGVVILLATHKNATLSEIKEDLWEEASKYPCYGMLHDQSVYIFECVNNMAELEEFTDESKRLCDIRPFCNLVKLTECSDDGADDKALNTQIGHLIGKGLHEFDTLKSAEVNDFRWKMRLLGEEIGRKRQTCTWQERLEYQFPPRLAATACVPRNVAQRLRDGNFVLQTKFENTETVFTFNVHHTMTPHKLLVQILNKKANSLNARGERPQDFVLKVVGVDEYLVGEYPLIQFVCIQEQLAGEAAPTLVTVRAENVPVVGARSEYESRDDLELKRPRQSSSTLTLQRKKGKHVSSWNITEKLSLSVCAVSRLNCDASRSVEVGVQAGLFHGGRSLCEPQKTSVRQLGRKGAGAGECDLDERITFDVQVCNVPRMARLCFVVFETSRQGAKGGKSRRVKDSGANKEYFMSPLAWVNTTVYDFRNQLRAGAMTLYMWTYAEDVHSEEALQPLGTVVSNPNVEHAASLTITFDSFGHEPGHVLYPSPERLVELARSEGSGPAATATADAQALEALRAAADSAQVGEMHEQERKGVWSLRAHCLQHEPELLPKLLHCVEWNDRRETAEVARLLSRWPRLSHEHALELLDYAYADRAVRAYAVRCLQQMGDEELSLYLLQLVQAIKHESHLACELVEFLLGRALSNQRIGHFLFWHLRSEMQTPSVSVRFGLILEAYCRGSREHVALLARQAEALDKLKAASELVRARHLSSKERARTALHDFLSEEHCARALADVRSPLEPGNRLARVRVDRCRVMDSKMRPLWLVWRNADRHADDAHLILKNGDDLRQDMLTLQMIRIMDRLWKDEGLDLRMSPYGCISTEHRFGMIEVVVDAETIANIQKEKGTFSATSAFRKGSLLAWLRDHNRTERALDKAIEEFTLSCAGYCVATYVLGVADRHSDNIMIRRSGRLFHVDFGHILGHFKEKFGFRRERVPFVLTHDFVHVINRGKKEAKEFEAFQRSCEQAFSILRRHGYLILSLCAMMISTGLPELSSEKDLSYLRETLVLDKSDDDAIAHFRSKFAEALCNSWKTSLNWASHNMAKNNKQ